MDLHLKNELNAVLPLLLLLSPHRHMMDVQAAAMDNDILLAMLKHNVAELFRLGGER